MRLDQVLEAISVGDVIGLLAALGAIIAALKWIKPVIAAMHDFLTDWQGKPERPGIEAAKPGVMQQLHSLQGDVTGLRDEVGVAKTLARDAAESAAEAKDAAKDAAYNSKPNHGGSAYDELMRAMTGVQTDVADLKTEVGTSVQDRTELWQHVSEQSEQIRAVTEHMNLTNTEGKEGD